MSQARPLPFFHLPAFELGRGKVRATARLLGFCLLALYEWVEWFLLIGMMRKGDSFPARAAWLTRYCRRVQWVLGLAPFPEGKPPAGGLLVCNHLSYLDVIGIAARSPTVFVCKSEVRSWPFLGDLVACAGTIFIDRERRSDVARAGHEIGQAIRQGATVCIFPEGTSSDGSDVLPFRSSLLAPAVDNGWPVTPAWIGYALEEGSVGEEIAYWGAMVFGPHFFNLLSKERIATYLRYGKTASPGDDRKELAQALRRQVIELGEVATTEARPPLEEACLS